MSEDTTLLKLPNARPIIYGEVLFDCFPDGNKVLGGAPFNVAWHLQGLGLNPLMISSVGDDNAGETVLRTMENWGMDTSEIQISKTHATGKVNIEINQEEPSYDIVTDQAYDNISSENFADNLFDQQYSLIYHGSLIRRSSVSRDSLNRLTEKLNAIVFIDVNLRPPWWQLEDVRAVLKAARIVKLNIHELAAIVDRPAIEKTDHEEVCRQFFNDYDLNLLIVTLGDEGAFLVNSEGVVTSSPVMAKNFIDAVGAGDSFSAVMIAGLIKQIPDSRLLQSALAFSAAICEIQGATTTNKALYESFL